MNKKILNIIIIVLLLCSLAYGQEDSGLGDNDVENEPDFNDIKNPTADDLAKVENPTIEQFDKLNEEEKRNYLKDNYREDLAESHLKESDFSDGRDLELGQKFFSESSNKINDNKESFSKYFKESYGKEIAINGQIKDYDHKTGLISTDKTTIKPIHDMAEKYDFEVTNDNKIIIKKDNSKGEKVKDELEGGNFNYDKKLNSFSNKGPGKINGVDILDGENIKITTFQEPIGDGKTAELKEINGKFKTIGGLTFNKDTPVTYTITDKEDEVIIKDAVINNIDKNSNLKIDAENTILPEGVVMQEGSIYYNKGQYKVNEHVKIDDIDIKSEQSNIYFEDKSGREGNYIVMDVKNKKIELNSEDKEINLKFNEGSPYMRIEEEDELNIVVKDAGLTINNRDDEKLVPEIQITDLKKGKSQINIENGLVNLDYEPEEDDFDIKYDEDGKSTPFSLIMKKTDGENLFKAEGKDLKFVFSNYNELALMDVDKEKGQSDGDGGFAPGEVSERISANYDKYTKDYLERKYPHIDFSGETSDEENVKRLSDAFALMPGKVIGSINEIEIMTDEDFEKQEGDAEGIAYDDGKIYFKESKLVESVIYHESAHTLHYDIEDSAQNILSSLLVNKESQFTKDWKKIADYDYGDGLGKGAKDLLPVTWKDGTDEPRDGFLRPYGANNVREDVATFSENINKDPQLYKDLMNTESNFYKNKDLSDTEKKIWANKYRSKLELLYKNGFISKENYDNVKKK